MINAYDIYNGPPKRQKNSYKQNPRKIAQSQLSLSPYKQGQPVLNKDGKEAKSSKNIAMQYV